MMAPRPERPMFRNPIEGVALGDPFVLRDRGRFYLYGTNDGPPLPDGRMVPVYRSDDLIHWDFLGGALEPADPGADHWAPEVLAWNGHFYMVVSFGDVERRGHALWVAVADRPEGPFQLRARISDPSEAFSIDGSWLLDDDGRLYLFRCLDFIEESRPPHGTGIVVQPMRDPLIPAGPPVVVLRAHAPWQLFQADRTMPLYGGRTFAEWTTIEGPAPVKRHGRYYCGYSGGNYAGDYGTGEAVADHPLGPYVDSRGAEGPIFGNVPGVVEGPGHFSVVRPDLVQDWIVLHGRRPGEPGRRVWLGPARWGPDGLIVAPPTDQSQPAPRLPDDLSRFGAAIPPGWRFEGGSWRLDDGRLLQADPEAIDALAWRETLELSGDWVIEAYLRFPALQTPGAGLVVRASDREFRVVVRPAEGLCAAVGMDGGSASAALPTLGAEPFDPLADHRIEVRAQAGRAEVRVDGVRLLIDLAVPDGPARLGLEASGPAAFDAVAGSMVPRG